MDCQVVEDWLKHQAETCASLKMHIFYKLFPAFQDSKS